MFPNDASVDAVLDEALVVLEIHLSSGALAAALMRR